jgi:hypothetical protein
LLTAKALTVLTRKDKKFTWGQKPQEAFETLKDRLCTASVLSYPDFKLPFILATDASGTGIGAILSQVQNGGYASRQKNMAGQVLSSSESELLAVVWALEHFRPYLLGMKFLLGTDPAALTYLRNFSDQNSK